MDIPLFDMERYQSRYFHLVDHDLSESGVLPLTLRDLLGSAADVAAFLETALGYPLSEGSHETRSQIARWYPGAGADQVTVVNGGSEANFLALWALLEPGDRLAFMLPNYCQGLGLGPALGVPVDAFRLAPHDGRWALDLESLERAVGPATRAVMVCNPNNPTGAVLTEDEMAAVIAIADRHGAWIVADEIYRGAELDTEETTPTFWGRTDRVVVTSGLSKAFAMPGLRIGWLVAPPEVIARVWRHHDYTTLTPGMLSDRLAARAMEPEERERILRRTRSIVRTNLRALEEWIGAHAYLRYLRPVAGAIAFADVDLAVSTRELVDRIREEQSVLLVAGEMFGLERGLRFGFGYDLANTMRGLAKADVTLAAVAARG